MSAGGSVGGGNTKFERKGTVATSSWRDLTDGQHNKFNKAFGKIDDGDHNSDKVQKMLNARMDNGYDQLPNRGALQSLIGANLPNKAVPGQASLTAQAGVNPYTTDYADNTFSAYTDQVLRSIGQARSGPMATRGGTAAQGYMMSDVVGQLGLNRQDVLAKNRQADAGIQQQAAGLLSQERSQMSQVAQNGINTGFGGYFNSLQDQQSAGSLASERAKMYADLVPAFTNLASRVHGTEKNDLRGTGAQTSSSVGAGMQSCCFIFLEAYNGTLPESVRLCRDKFAPECSARRRGYILTSKWLVPAMRVSSIARTLTNHLLVKPLTYYGEWLHGRNKLGWVAWPVKQAWFTLWKQLGK
jgi:hypothetical protein